MRAFQFGSGQWELGRKTYIMGIINVTPDSFSDGGRYLRKEDALSQAARLVADGVDVLDIGGESTRPGYQDVPWEEEWRRIKPVLEGIKKRYPHVPVSVDTQKTMVALQAVSFGADIINDIWGLRRDPSMIDVLRSSRAGYVMMFNREPSWTEGQVQVDRIKTFFEDGLALLEAEGVHASRVLVDPGLGFGYGVNDNWAVLKHLNLFRGLGAGLLLGPSRKRFLGQITGHGPLDRDIATAAVAALSVSEGVDVVRVHNVRTTKDALAVADRWIRP